MSCFYQKHNVLDNGFYLRLQVKTNSVGPNQQSSPRLRTSSTTWDQPDGPSHEGRD
jgi:hypothetical protein